MIGGQPDLEITWLLFIHLFDLLIPVSLSPSLSLSLSMSPTHPSLLQGVWACQNFGQSKPALKVAWPCDWRMATMPFVSEGKCVSVEWDFLQGLLAKPPTLPWWEYTHTRTHGCTYTHTSTYTHLHKHTHKHTYRHTHICPHAHSQTNIHTQRHAHKHTHTS